MLIHRLLILPMVLSPLLAASGCGGLVAAGSALGAVGTVVNTANQVAGTVDPVITTACQESEKGKSAANAVTATGLLSNDVTTKVKSIESFGDAACANPPQGNSAASTAVWLGQLVGELVALTTPATPAS